MKRFYMPFMILGVLLVMVGCSNNPFYPKAEVRLVKVSPENQKLTIEITITPEGIKIDYEVPQPVEFTFREMYGGRWADIQHYRIEYVSVTSNYGDTLPFGPLDGGFNLLVPPGGEATASLYTVPFDIIDHAINSFLQYHNVLPDSIVITFQERVHFEGEDELGNKITWDVPHSTVVYYKWSTEGK